MRRLLAGIGVVVALGVAAQASAATVVSPESDQSRPYQRWIDRSRMPTPNVEVTVHRGWCPTEVATACTSPGSSEIWVARRGGATKRTFLHELGHQFDYSTMDDADRDSMRALIPTQEPWRSPSLLHSSPHEVFAAVYAGCALGGWHNRSLGAHEGGVLRKWRQHKACNLIRSVGAREARPSE